MRSFARDTKRGFTLIELLVVITIITILSLISVLTYRGFTDRAKDTKRKAELSAIAKVYLAKAVDNNKFVPLQNGDFGGAPIPKTPEGNLYPCLIGPDSNCSSYAEDRFAYCVSLGNNQSAPCLSDSPTCFCQSGGAINTSSSGGGGGGGGGGGNPSCDPYGMLSGPFSGLVGYWKMDEDTSPFTDYSGNNNTGIWGGVSSATGKFNKAVNTAGLGKYVNLGNSALLKPTNAITLSAWVFLNSDDATPRWIISDPNGNSPYYDYTLFVGSGRKVNFGLTSLTDSGYQQVQSIGIPIGQWVLLVGIYDGTTLTLYWGIPPNVLVTNSIAKAGPIRYFGTGNWANVFIGSWNGGATYEGFKDFIDDVRVYNKALSPIEIQALYNGGSGCIP